MLFTIFRYEKLVIEYEIFPYLPAFAEYFLWMFGVKYIADYDDAIFHNYDLSHNKIIRKVLSNKIGYVMKYSQTVTAGNSYLKKYAKNAGARDIVVLPTVIDIERYVKKKYDETNRPLVIGWIGSPSTFKYMKNILPVLEEISKVYAIELRIIGAKAKIESTYPVHLIKWTEDSEAEEIRKFDVGIMPLEDTPWEKGKCGYKLIQYMATGIPVIASSIGVNTEIVQHGKNGYLVHNHDEWREAIVSFINNRKIISSFGNVSRKTVEDKYNLNITQTILIGKIKKMILDVIWCSLFIFISLSLPRVFLKGKDKKFTSALKKLILFHFLLGFCYFLFTNNGGGDAYGYWTIAKSMSSSDFGNFIRNGIGTRFMEAFNYFPAKILGMSFFANTMLFTMFGAIGICCFLQLF